MAINVFCRSLNSSKEIPIFVGEIWIIRELSL